VNQDGRHTSWPGWIKKLLRLLDVDTSQLTAEEQVLSRLAHVAVSFSVAIFFLVCFKLAHANSVAHFQHWQLCENNFSPTSATRISLAKQQHQINGMIDALRTATTSQKIRLRQLLAAMVGLVDSSCQERLYFTALHFTLGLFGTGAAIVVTVTLGLTVIKGIQKANRLAVNLAGTSLIVLTAIVNMSNFFSNNNKNLPIMRELNVKTRTLLSAYADDLFSTKLFLASPAELEAWMRAKTQALEPLLALDFDFSESWMDQVLTQSLPKAAAPPPTASPPPLATGAPQPRSLPRRAGGG